MKEKLKEIEEQLRGVINCSENKLHNGCEQVINKCIFRLMALQGECEGNMKPKKKTKKPIEGHDVEDYYSSANA